MNHHNHHHHNNTLLSHSLVWSIEVDLCNFLGGAAHEEERDAEEGGHGQHHHREAWDGLQRETYLLHDDPTYQHPHGYCWQVQSTWEPQTT